MADYQIKRLGHSEEEQWDRESIRIALLREELSPEDSVRVNGAWRQLGDDDSFIEWGPRRRRSRRRASLIPNLLPIVDLTFLLVIFFLFTTGENLRQVLPLPAQARLAHGAGAGGQEQTSDISVRINGGFEVQGVGVPLTTPASELERLIRDAAAQGVHPARVLIEPGDGADLEAIAKVVDATRMADVGDVAFVEPSP